MSRKPKPPRKSQPPRKWPDWYYEDLERDAASFDEEFDREFDAEIDRELDDEFDRELDGERAEEVSGASDNQRELFDKLARALLAKMQSEREQGAPESAAAASVTPEQASPAQLSAEQPSRDQPVADGSSADQGARDQGVCKPLASAPPSPGLPADSQSAAGSDPVAAAAPAMPMPADNDQPNQPALKHGERCGPGYIVTPPSPSGIMRFIMLDDEPGDDTAPPADAQPHEFGSPPPAIASPAAAIPAEAQAAAAAARLAPVHHPAANSVTPYWLPEDADFDAWPADVKQAVVDVINPSYEELVIRARPGMARMTGMSIIQLGWLEMIEILKLKRLGHGCELADPNDPQGLVRMADQMTRSPGESREQIIERMLRLANVKLKACNFLGRLRDFKTQWSGIETWSPPPGLSHGGG